MSDNLKYNSIFNNNNQCISAEQLKLYTQDLLTPIEKREIENHLLECDFCNDALDGIKHQTSIDDYKKTIEILNKQIKRRNQFSTRKKVLYSPMRLAAVAASILFLICGLGIYFGWFLNTRFQHVAKRIENLSSQIGNIAQLNPIKTHDTITIIKEQTSENYYNNQVSATDDISPLNDEHVADSDTSKLNASTPLETKDNLADVKNLDAPPQSDAELSIASSSNKTETENFSKVKIASSATLNSDVIKKATLKSNELLDAIKLFKNQNFVKATPQFLSIVSKEPNNFEARYYLGLNYYQTGKYIDAIKQFDYILINNNLDWFDDARYQKALTHLKINDEITSKNLFEQIVSENGKYKLESEERLKELQ